MFCRIKTPKKGYCGFYAFTLGLIYKVMYENHKLPHDFSNNLFAQLKNEDVYNEILTEINLTSFTKKIFNLDSKIFISEILEPMLIRNMTSVEDLIKSIDSAEQLYAIVYSLGVALVHNVGFKKYTGTDFSKLCYPSGINLTSYDLDAYFGARRYYYQVTDTADIGISYSYKRGHFEYLLPYSHHGIFNDHRIMVDEVNLSDRKIDDATSYNYLTKASAMVSQNKFTLFAVGVAGLTIAASAATLISSCNLRGQS